MLSRRIERWFAAWLLLCALAVGGCGGDGEPSAADATMADADMGATDATATDADGDGGVADAAQADGAALTIAEICTTLCVAAPCGASEFQNPCTVSACTQDLMDCSPGALQTISSCTQSCDFPCLQAVACLDEI